MAISYLLEEDGTFVLLEDNASRIIIDDTGAGGVNAPTGVLSAKLTIPNHLPALVGPTHIATIPYVYLTWTPSNNASAFDHYLIQRFDEEGLNTIAYLLDETINHFADLEIRHGLPTNWLITTVLRTGDMSAAVQFQTQTIAIADKCAVYLVSNGNPDEAIALYDQPGLKYTDSNSDVTFVDIEGRDTPMGFIPAERGGDVFTRTFTLAFNDTTVTSGAVRAGRNLFRATERLLTDSALPGITVLDGNTDRWYTTAKITGWTVDEPGSRYHMTVEFHETSPPFDPPSVTSTNPWVHP